VTVDFVESALAALDRKGLRRTLRTIERIEGPYVWIDGKRLVCFCSNDYLGLAQADALRESYAPDGLPAGSGASRLLAGSFESHRELERGIARFKGLPASLMFGSAYMANVGLLTAIADGETTVLSDALNHASIIDGIRLSRGTTKIFEHLRPEAVETALRQSRGRRLIVTESLFSMDGDQAPLDDYWALAERYGAELMVDDTHAFGIAGEGGRGFADSRVRMQVCNLAKAGGALGGFVLGSEGLVELLISRARTFVYTTSLPPVMCRVGARSLELIASAEDRRTRLRELSNRLRTRAAEVGLRVQAAGPIFPIVIGATDRATAAAAALWERGFFLPAIRPPTVPEGTARLRISLTALHEPAHVDSLVDAISEIL
jgi:8-amino-7-oxononanoate synthase